MSLKENITGNNKISIKINNLINYLDPYFDKLIIISLLFMSLILGLIDLMKKQLWEDEIVIWFITNTNSLETVYTRSLVHHLPLFDILLYFWINILGNNPFNQRLLSVLFFILTPIVLYPLSRLFISKISSFLVVCLYQMNIMFLGGIQGIHAVSRYPLFYFLALVSTLFFFKIILTEKSSSNKNYSFYIISTILLLISHVYAIFLVFSFNFIFITKYLISFVKSDINREKFFVMALILFLPLFFAYPVYLSYFSGYFTRSAIELVNIYIIGRTWLMLNMGSLKLALLSIFLLFFAIIYFLLFMEKLRIYLLLFLFSLILLFPIILGLFISVYQFHYLAYCLAFYLILMVWLIEQFVNGKVFENLISFLNRLLLKFNQNSQFFEKNSRFILEKMKILMICFILVFTLLILSHNINQSLLFYDEPSRADWKNISLFIADKFEDGDSILVYPSYFDLYVYYYLTQHDLQDAFIEALDIGNYQDQLINLFKSSKNIFIFTWFGPFIDYNMSKIFSDYNVIIKNDFQDERQIITENYNGSASVLITLQIKI